MADPSVRDARSLKLSRALHELKFGIFAMKNINVQSEFVQLNSDVMQRCSHHSIR